MASKFTYKKRYAEDGDFREKWQTAKSSNTIKLFIDGEEIPSYSNYSYIDTKNYFKEPERSAMGVINNLNSYATFLTPKIIFSFNSMPISAYRVIMRLIKERNEFLVTAYDPVEDEYVTRKMYFAPQDYPEIYQMGYEALRINNIEFELIGTNADLNLYSLIYNSNVTSTPMDLLYETGDEMIRLQTVVAGYMWAGRYIYCTQNSWEGSYTSGSTYIVSGEQGAWVMTETSGSGSTSNITTGLTFYYNQDITIGDYDTDVGIDPKAFENAGYTFVEWNTMPDGSGISYNNGQTGIKFTTNVTLYAIWTQANNYTVSFNYASSSHSGDDTVSKEVVYGGFYGYLPYNISREGYSFEGWYTQLDGQGTKITMSMETGYSTMLYQKTYNETLYAYWVGAEVTISFDSAEGTGEILPIVSRAGESVTLPTATDVLEHMSYSTHEAGQEPVGYQCIDWATRTAVYKTVDGQSVFDHWEYSKFADLGATITCPLSNITLYAHWQRGYTVKYYTTAEDTTASNVHVYIAIEREPPYVTRMGYRFLGWYKDRELTQYASFPLEITENTDMFGRWERLMVITYNLYKENGSYISTVDYVPYNTNLTSNDYTPTRVGYTFAGWYTDEELTTAVTYPVTITEDVVFYAKWEETNA